MSMVVKMVVGVVEWVRQQWRDIWMLLVTGIALIAVLNAGGAGDRAGKVAHVASGLAKQNAMLVRRVSADELQTCTIQARGLPVSHQLAAAMGEIHALLTLPPSPDAPPVPPRVERIVAGYTDKHGKHHPGLNDHLAAYQRAEAKQPQTRAC